VLQNRGQVVGFLLVSRAQELLEPLNVAPAAVPPERALYEEFLAHKNEQVLHEQRHEQVRAPTCAPTAPYVQLCVIGAGSGAVAHAGDCCCRPGP
jgi:hypothetical protein